jgi:hypothetical protein
MNRNVLLKGKVRGRIQIGRPENKVFLLKLDHCDKIHLAVFKPITGYRNLTITNSNKCYQAFREVMAFEIDRLLRINFVPTTVCRRIDGELGSLQEFAAEAIVINMAEKVSDVEFYKIAVFDYLIGNSDRNKGNGLYHRKPILIDNGASFPDVIKGKGIKVFKNQALRERPYRDKTKLDDAPTIEHKRQILTGIARVDVEKFRKKYSMSKKEMMSFNLRRDTIKAAIIHNGVHDLVYSLIR